MHTIFKYRIDEIADEVSVKLPVGAEVVHVGVQNGFICLWARVCDQKMLVPRTFYIRGTGHPIDGYLKYLGTVHIDPFVWHVFE